MMSIQLIHCCVPTKQTTENNILATLLSGEYYFWVFWGVKFLHKFTLWSDSTFHSSLSFTHPFSRSPTHPGKSSPAQSLLCLHVHGALDSSWAVHWTYVSWEGNIHTACKLIKKSDTSIYNWTFFIICNVLLQQECPSSNPVVWMVWKVCTPTVVKCGQDITNFYTTVKSSQKQALATVLYDRHVLYQTVSQHPLQLLWLWLN